MKKIWGVLVLGLLARPSAADVVMTFDDGWASTTRIALPIMIEANMRGTAFVTTGQVGTPNFSSWEEILQLKASGWEIGNHTNSHPDLSTKTPEGVREEIVVSQHKFAEHDVYPITFAAPYGIFSTAIKEYLKTVFIGARGAGKLSESPTFVLKEVDQYELPVYGVYTPVDLVDVESRIASLKDSKHMIFMFHRIVEKPMTKYEITPSDFKAIIALCDKYKVKVITLRELIQK